MFEIAGFIVFLGVGVAVMKAVVWLIGLYQEHVPSKYQERIYQTSVDLPKFVWAWFIGIVFWTTVGATLLHFALRLFGPEGLLPSASWAPRMFVFFVLILLVQFWDSPHRLKGTFKPRGRSIHTSVDSSEKKGAPTSSAAKRGRTIRSYRDIK